MIHMNKFLNQAKPGKICYIADFLTFIICDIYRHKCNDHSFFFNSDFFEDKGELLKEVFPGIIRK